jgi:NHL repeat
MGHSRSPMAKAYYSTRMASQSIISTAYGSPIATPIRFFASSSAGQWLSSLGERHAPHWLAPFNHPTKAAIAADGEIYVADGYGNARIHRFSTNGQHLASFGAVGSRAGEFMTPHSLVVDRSGRLLVCDRENDRV